MMSFILIGAFLATIMTPTGHAQCPALCSCSTNQVSCSAVNLTAIPRLIPHSITSLDLSHNQIHHVTQTVLTSLRHVVDLNLEHNVITSIDEAAFLSLESLQGLDLSHNRLSSVTDTVLHGVTSTLTQLDLGYNDLQHIDGAFINLEQLSRLDLPNNRIERIGQMTFKNLANLRYLFLADNQIHHIDKRAFRSLDKLMYLVLKGNPLQSVSRLEFHSQFLSYLDLSECGLTDIPRGLPSSVRYLQLRRNNITELHSRSFRECPYISILVLDENGLSDIEEGTFAALSYLQQLWLNGNRLALVPSQLPPTLQRLLMDQNSVTSLSAIFPRDNQLQTVSFMGNEIEHIDFNAFGELRVLESLDLSNNRIKHFYGNMFENNSALISLQLSKNPLLYMHSHAFWGLIGLETLSLSYIESPVHIHPDAFEDFSSLVELQLDSSPHLVKSIMSSHLLNSVKFINILSLKNSDLSTLSDRFPTFFHNLTTLYLSSSFWHCDTTLIWLRDWLQTPSSITIDTIEEVLCYSPISLHGRALASLLDSEFVQSTTTIPVPTGPIQFTTFPPLEISTTPKRPVTTPTTKQPSTTTKEPYWIADDSDYAIEGSADAPLPYNPRGQQVQNGEPPPAIDLGDQFQDFQHFNQDPNERRHIGFDWDAWFSESGALPSGRDKTTKFPNPPYNHRGVLYEDSSTLDPPASDKSLEGMLTHPSLTTIVIVAVTLATAIIAAIIIAFIIYFVRKHRTAKADTKPVAYQNGIPLKHKNDVLYFMPQNGAATSVTSQTSNCDVTIENKSMTDSTKTLSSGRSQKTKEHVTLLPKQNTSPREVNKQHVTFMPGREIALIPGRDINHEGPIRVYKWEDF